MTIPASILQFMSAAIVPGNICLPFHYFGEDEFDRYQVGYRSHGNTGADLTSSKPGSWQPGWYVIALNGMDDPFFVDFTEAALDYPVYFAWHGAGSWTAMRVGENIEQFSRLLTELKALEQPGRLQYLETHADIKNEFWKEVYESETEIPDNEPVDMTDWVPGNILITHLGSDKMKVIQYLKETLRITPQEALQLSKQGEIKVKHGYLVHLQRDIQHIEKMGATVVFKADEG